MKRMFWKYGVLVQYCFVSTIWPWVLQKLIFVLVSFMQYLLFLYHLRHNYQIVHCLFMGSIELHL